MPHICVACDRAYDDREAVYCEECGSRLLLNDRYRVLRHIGDGGSSSTFEVQEIESEARYALKVLDLKRVQDWKALELFDRQYGLLKGLDHPGIPDAVEEFEDDWRGGPARFLVQELIPGESLKDRLAGGARYDEKGAVLFLEQMLDILGYLHSFSPPVLHRDVKPSNIIIRPDGRPVLIDFDTARGVGIDHSIADGTMVGTAGFVPMEQLAGRAVPASDLYGLGMTLVAMLTLKDVNDLPVERNQVKFEPYTNVSKTFAAILRRLLAPAVEDRYPDVKSVQAALQALGGRAPAAPRRAEPAAGSDLGAAARLVPLVPAARAAPASTGPSRSWPKTVGIGLAVALAWYWILSGSNLSFDDDVYDTLYDTELSELDVDDLEGVDAFWVESVLDSSSESTDTIRADSLGVVGRPDARLEEGEEDRFSDAWAPDEEEDGLHAITVDFGRSVWADAVLVVEVNNPGAVVRVDDMSDGWGSVILWEGEESATGSSRVLRFDLAAPRSISSLRVILDTDLVDGFNQIDAIGVVPSEEEEPADEPGYRDPADEYGDDGADFGDEQPPLEEGEDEENGSGRGEQP